MLSDEVAPTGKPADGGSDGGGDSGDKQVTIQNFHHQTNDIDALRRLAETDPDLARQVLAQRDRADRREANSFIVGMITAGVLAVVLVIVAGVTFVSMGWWQSICFVAAILAGSHFLRTALTGKWSDTSWFGKLFTVKPPSDEDEG